MMKRVLFGLTLPLLLTTSQSVSAIETEYALKAGFLFNFARYSEWTDTTPILNDFVLCSPDSSFIEIASTVLTNREVNHLPIVTRTISMTDADISQCQILFITSDTITQWLNTPLGQINNVMIVGETEDFIAQGGQIRFFLSGGKVRFEVSPKRLTSANITMSSKVLRLGRVVEL
ncbi:YfiR family protein [Shewanella sp. MF05960]|uniref:YfiR family protein n=1 Tax=Shewanella sp. MF05960 TaxID=3434874 RepID=UPI003D7958CC